ncbi:hypothetical protein LN650_06985 [Klebsiella pneumoniae subsp. pneumoniae]|nr:hypothetical protein [Klebsiella pneumoniae subsp. pneumoniae]
MVRSAQVDTSLLCDYSGSTCELDSQPGRYNPGMQWLASGVLEWVRKLLWSADTPWQTLIDEAQAIPPGAQGVRMQCDLLASQHAGWQGVTLNTTRGHFYRAALEGLSDQLAQHLQTLEKIGGFRAKELLLVGGGSRNALWNQIKANRLRDTDQSPRRCRNHRGRRGDVWLVWRGRVLFARTGQSAGRVPLPLFLAAN